MYFRYFIVTSNQNGATSIFFILTSTKSAKFHSEKLSISCEFVKLASRLNSFQIWHLVDFPDDHSRFQAAAKVTANTQLFGKIWMANWRWEMTTYIGYVTAAFNNVLQTFEGSTAWKLCVQICEHVKMKSYNRSLSCIIEQI
jgi:hypothetical protein